MHEYLLFLIFMLLLSYYLLNRILVTSAAFKVCYIILSLLAIALLLI